MKKNIFYLLIILLSACNMKTGLQNENGTIFDSNKLKGKYKLDISEIVAEVTKAESSETTEKIAKGIIGLASTSMSAEINFYGNGKGVWRIDLGWLGAVMNEKNKIQEFEYKIINDSILVLKDKQLTIRKFSDSFDFIELISKEERQRYILNKVTE